MSLRRAYVGLGANLGDAVAALQQAAVLIADWSEAVAPRGSAMYRSAPVDSSGPDYWNAVLAIDTALEPESLLVRLQAIEQAHGRERPYRNAPRTLDLDLLALGDARRSGTDLVLPHPRLHQRAFVLLPLLEVEPGLTLPELGLLSAYLPSVQDQRIERSPLQLFSSK